MLSISGKVQEIEESQTLALTTEARHLKEAGIDVVSLTAGEPDFPTPRHVKDAAIRAIEENFTHYTPNEGIGELLRAIIQKFATENDLHFEPPQVMVSTGAKHAIFNALQAMCNEGDEVVILSPYWVSYPAIVRLVDAVPVVVRTRIEDDFIPDLKTIRKAINRKTKALILNSPGNPTGVVYTRALLEEIASIVEETGIYIVSDEIYEKVLFDGRSHFSVGSIKEIRDQVVTVNGVSKAYAMTGWRIGYMGGPASIVAAAAKVQSQTTSNANSIAQKATIAALKGSEQDIAMMVKEFQRRRDYVYHVLSSIHGVRVVMPHGAMYFYFGVNNFYGRKTGGTAVRDSAAMAHYLLEHHHVASVPGFAFGDDNCLRISFACSMEEITKGMNRVRQGLEQLQ